MESLTKNRQPPAVLRALVARGFGPAEVVDDGPDAVRELGHGWFNVAYRIRLRRTSGRGVRDVVLKIAPPPGVEVMTYERGAMAIELVALRLVAEQTAVPVPEVEFADTSRQLCDADYFFMPFIDADNLGIVDETLVPDARSGYLRALGAANRQLNEIRGPWFGPLAGPGRPSWRAFFTDLVHDVLADGERRSVDLGWDYDAIRAVVERDGDCLDDVTEPRFVEWDLWPSNVMVRDGAIVAIIDHERAFFGDPLIEAGFVGLTLSAFGDSTDFARGYGWGPLTATELRRRRLYSLHLALIMVIETVYRGHTEPQQYLWARERLAELRAGLAPPLG